MKWKLPLLIVLGLGMNLTGSHALGNPTAKPKTITHIVTSGDTLSGLAKHYGSSVEKIRKRNRLSSDRLRIGQKLRIRALKNARSSSKIKRRKGSKKAKKSKKFKPRHGGDCTYTVRKGDSLWKIARKKKTTISKLRKWNGKKAKRLRPGRALKVCKLVIGGGAIKQRNAIQLPRRGPGYEAPRRNRVWGQSHAIKAIEEASASTAEKFPGTHPLFVGDVSFKKGGYMPPHKSHRRGIDADISYFVKGNPAQGRFAVATVKTLDPEKNWHFIEALLRTGVVHQFYVEHSLQGVLYAEAERQGYSKEELKEIFEYPRPIGSGRLRKIRHIKGHDDHLHVRFVMTSKVPKEKEESIPPEMPPEGDGGVEVEDKEEAEKPPLEEAPPDLL